MKNEYPAMNDIQTLDDALMMMEATHGDPELAAIDHWLRDTFAALRRIEGEESAPN